MKKYIIVLLSALTLFSSCSDFLDNANKDGVLDPGNLDRRPEAMFAIAANVYNVSNRNWRHWAAYAAIAVRGDDFDDAAVGNQVGFLDARYFRYNAFSTFWGLNENWRNFYNVVLSANSALIALEGIEAELVTPDSKIQNLEYQAQVRFLRAYSYFYLTRLFGDVPLITTITPEALMSAQSPRADIYAFINSELNIAIKNLPAVRPNEMERRGEVTMLSALALRAKVNADFNDWKLVESATDSIIATGKMRLHPDFNTLFKGAGRLSDESFFELQYTDRYGDIGDISPGEFFMFQAPRLASNNPFPTGSGWGFMTPSDEIINLASKRGETVRKNTMFLFAGTTTPEGDILASMTSRGDSVFNGKAYFPSRDMNPVVTRPGAGNNIRMLRYADILLLNAEAKVNLGKNGDVSFNLVRERAGMPKLTNVTKEQIWEERFIELGCEWGERFFDLVRTDRAATVLQRFGFVKGQSEFYPVPQAQRDLNPNLR